MTPPQQGADGGRGISSFGGVPVSTGSPLAASSSVAASKWDAHTSVMDGVAYARGALELDGGGLLGRGRSRPWAQARRGGGGARPVAAGPSATGGGAADRGGREERGGEEGRTERRKTNHFFQRVALVGNIPTTPRGGSKLRVCRVSLRCSRKNPRVLGVGSV